MEPNRKFSRRNLLRLAAGSGVAFSVLGLAACAAPTPTPTAVPPTATTAPAAKATEAPKPTAATAATPAAKPVGSTASGNVRWQFRGSDDDLKKAQAFVDQTFAKTYPNIKVSIEPAPDGRDEKLITAMVGGNAPDVFESWSDNVTQYADRGQVLDVEPLTKRDYTADDLKDFYPWQWKDFVIPTAQGQNIRFGLPKYVNVMFVWYNKDIFDKGGVEYPNDTWTHDNYAEAARKLTKWTGNVPDVFGLHYFPWSWDRYWYKLEIWGGNVVDPNDNTKAVFDSEQSLAAFEWMRKLMWDDKAMAQRLLLLGTGTSYNATALFAAGKFAMNEDGFYPFSMARTIEKKIKWGWAHTPKGPTGKRRVLGTTDGFVEWKNSKVQDAAWELMKFLAGKDYQLNQTRSTGLLPIRFSALADWKKICIEGYPELADSNLDVGPKAMEEGYPGNRQLFKKDAEARQIVVPALDAVFVSGSQKSVNYFKEVAAQVTAKMRAT